MDTLQKGLKRLQEVGLKLNFSKPRIKFLGHEVDETGNHTVDDKTVAVAKFPQPKTVDNVRSFLGLLGYYRPFIKSFVAQASPLTMLLKKNEIFHCGIDQDNSFKDLKQALHPCTSSYLPRF